MLKTRNKKNSLTPGDLDQIAGLLDHQFEYRIKPFVEQKIDSKIDGLEISLKKYIHEGIETVMESLDVITEDIDELKKVRA